MARSLECQSLIYQAFSSNTTIVAMFLNPAPLERIPPEVIMELGGRGVGDEFSSAERITA
jgi:hypothetical protein